MEINNRFAQPLDSSHLQELQHHFCCLTSAARVTDVIILKSKLDRILNIYLNPAKEVLVVQTKCESNSNQKTGSKSRKRIRYRKNTKYRNVIIHGLISSQHEPTNQDICHDVKAFFREKLQIEINPSSAHLLGTSEKKPVRVRLRCLEDKKRIFKNCHKLKPYGRQFRVTDDLNYEERGQLYPLQERLNQEKAKGNHTLIRNKTLFVNGIPIMSVHGLAQDVANNSTHRPSPELSAPVLATEETHVEAQPKITQSACTSPHETEERRAMSPPTDSAPKRRKRHAPQPPALNRVDSSRASSPSASKFPGAPPVPVRRFTIRSLLGMKKEE